MSLATVAIALAALTAAPTPRTWKGKTLAEWTTELQAEGSSDAIDAVAQFGPDAAGAIPALALLLGARNEFTGCAAARALADIGPGSVDSLGAYLKRYGDALRDKKQRGDKSHPSMQVSACALRALGDIGPDSASALEAITPFLGDWDQDAAAAREALMKIGPASVPAVRAALKTGPAGLRLGALGTLGYFEDADSSRAIAEALSDQDLAVAQMGAQLLGQRTLRSSPLFATLLQAMAAQDGRTRAGAAAAAAASPVIHEAEVRSQLVRLARDPEATVRSAAFKAIRVDAERATGAYPEELTQAVRAGLADKDWSVRKAASAAEASLHNAANNVSDPSKGR